jgi:hypothetical protein
MNIAGAFQVSRFAQAVNEAMRVGIAAVWAPVRAGFGTWSRGVLERLLAETPCEDPTVHFGMREWADLPHYHPSARE